MSTETDQDKLPKLRPTPLTWLYVAFGVLMLILFIWGFIRASG